MITRLFIVAPFSARTIEDDFRRATAVITTVMGELGPNVIPYLPLRAQGCYAPTPENLNILTVIDTRNLMHCDAVLMLPGASPVTGLEVEMGVKSGKFVTGSVTDFLAWAKSRISAAA